MSPETVHLLIDIGITLGADLAKALADAVHAGDTSAVAQLSKVLPDSHQEALMDAAVIERQTKLAHGTAT